MEKLKTVWDFFQNEILGMKWLYRLIGDAIGALGFDPESRIGGEPVDTEAKGRRICHRQLHSL